jgi:hypothetical protein
MISIQLAAIGMAAPEGRPRFVAGRGRKIDTMLISIRRRKTVVLCAFTSLIGCLAAVTQAQALQLITPEEAALPAGVLASPSGENTRTERRSPTRRPSIAVVWPSPDAGVVHSPLDLRLRFRAFGGSTIDPDSVVVTYLKKPAIDITQRIMPFITATGIEVPQAQIPAGRHEFWVEVKDREGRVGRAIFSFEIAK